MSSNENIPGWLAKAEQLRDALTNIRTRLSEIVGNPRAEPMQEREGPANLADKLTEALEDLNYIGRQLTDQTDTIHKKF